MLATLLLFALPKFSATFPVSPDGVRYIESPSNSPVVRMLDAQSGEVQYEIKEFRVRPNVIVFSPNGAKVAASNTLGEVCLWSANSGKVILKAADADYGKVSPYFSPRTPPDGPTFHLQFSPDSQSLAFGTLRLKPRTRSLPYRNVFSLWDAESGKQMSKNAVVWPTHFMKFSFVNNGKTLRVLSSKLTDFDLPLGKSKEKKWSRDFISMSDDGSLVSEFSSGGISIWNVASRRRVLRIGNALLGQPHLIFAPDNRSFAMLWTSEIMYPDGNFVRLNGAELRSYPSGKVLWKSPGTENDSLCYSPDGSAVLLPNFELRKISTWELVHLFKKSDRPLLGNKCEWQLLPN